MQDTAESDNKRLTTKQESKRAKTGKKKKKNSKGDQGDPRNRGRSAGETQGAKQDQDTGLKMTNREKREGTTLRSVKQNMTHEDKTLENKTENNLRGTPNYDSNTQMNKGAFA